MYSVGIDLGGTLTKVVLVSSGGRLIEARKLPTLAGLLPTHGLGLLRPFIEGMASEKGLPYPPPDGCGIGIPGVIDFGGGRVVFSGALGWQEVPVVSLAQRALECDVGIDTDAGAGALAELQFGCARDSSDMLYISWGTGIGAGLVISRTLYHSRGGAMGNLGHMLADQNSTKLCYCGCRGCLETEVGGKALVEQARERLRATNDPTLHFDTGQLTVERITDVVKHGDLMFRPLLERSATLIARVLAGALALLNPDTVVLGGGVSHCFSIIREAFELELRLRTPHFIQPAFSVVQSHFPDYAGALGAAILGSHREISAVDSDHIHQKLRSN